MQLKNTKFVSYVFLSTLNLENFQRFIHLKALNTFSLECLCFKWPKIHSYNFSIQLFSGGKSVIYKINTISQCRTKIFPSEESGS